MKANIEETGSASTPALAAAEKALAGAWGAKTNIESKIEDCRQRREELAARKAQSDECRREKSEEHAKTVLNGGRTGALAQEIAELSAESEVLARALIEADEEMRVLSAQLKAAQEKTAQVEFALALEEYDAAMVAAENVARKFWVSTLGPLAEKTYAARVRANDCEHKTSRLNSTMTAGVTRATDYKRPGHMARWLLVAYERWMKGEPI